MYTRDERRSKLEKYCLFSVLKAPTASFLIGSLQETSGIQAQSSAIGRQLQAKGLQSGRMRLVCGVQRYIEKQKQHCPVDESI